MPAIIKEKDMFVDAVSASFAVPVNTKGIMGAGLAKYIKNTHPAVYHQYKRDCDSGKILVQGYSHTMDLMEDYICIITKHDWQDESKYEYIIDSLLKFDQDCLMNDENMFGHCIEDLQLPALGCGLGKLKWEDIEDRLVNDLRETTVNFIFCVESWRRPSRFAELLRNNVYYFKGDTVLGLEGHYPFTLNNTNYVNALDYIMEQMTEGMDVGSDKIGDLRAYMKQHGLTLANGRMAREVLSEACYEAKNAQYQQLPKLKAELDKRKDRYLAFTGQVFPRVYGIGCQHHELHTVEDKADTWHGQNLLGEILMSF